MSDTSVKWLRAAVFGAMDGLVSNTSLIAGVAGGGLTPHQITLVGLGGLTAGAISMGLGEYVSVKAHVEAHGHASLSPPPVAALASFLAFSIGAFIPLSPYLFGAEALFWALLAGGLGLFAAGVFISRFTGKNWFLMGMRQLLFGAIAAAVTYLIGTVLVQ